MSVLTPAGFSRCAFTSTQSAQWDSDWPTIAAVDGGIAAPAPFSQVCTAATWPRLNIPMNESMSSAAGSQHMSLSARPSW
jgi:hypothetical protein